VYCPECGYNLRGQNGSDVTCPECGNRYRLSDLLRRCEGLKELMRSLESRLTLCVAGVWLLLAGLVGVAISRHPVFTAVALSGFVTWCYGVLKFSGGLRVRGPSLAACAWYHAAGLLWFALCAAVGMTAYWCHNLLSARWAWFIQGGIIGVGVLAAWRCPQRLRRIALAGPYQRGKRCLRRAAREHVRRSHVALDSRVDVSTEGAAEHQPDDGTHT
jgi:predicted RNA-binding Zn-ribbon protein involved in translation (DUF1610 family)